VVNAVEFSLHVAAAHDVAIGKVTKIQLDTGLKAPLQRDLVDGAGRLAPVHRGMVVIGRIEMGSTMRCQFDAFNGPGGSVRQLVLGQARKDLEHLWQTFLVIRIRDFGSSQWRIRDVL
jgi:hypothetical protein